MTPTDPLSIFLISYGVGFFLVFGGMTVLLSYQDEGECDVPPLAFAAGWPLLLFVALVYFLYIAVEWPFVLLGRWLRTRRYK